MTSMLRPATALVLGLAALLTAAPLGAAALQWESTHLALTAAPFDEQAAGTFKFTNTSDGEVTILAAQADCGCTVPTLAKKTYAPGEAGELRAVFTFNGREGPNLKTITVQTDESDATSYKLEFLVDIPRLFATSPAFLVWRKGEPATPKTARIRALRPEVVQPVAVASSDARFHVGMTPDPDDPAVFVITVTPPAEADDDVVIITARTNAPAERPLVVTLYARVF